MGTNDDISRAESDEIDGESGYLPADSEKSASADGPVGNHWRKLARCIRDIIKKRRILLGMTQQELAARAGFSANYVARLEGKPHDVSLDNLKRLAKSLEITGSDLLREADELCETTVFLDDGTPKGQ